MENKTRKTKGVPDAVDRYVGAKIREAREFRNVSQEKLAEAIGLTFQQIQKYEMGKNRVASGRLAHISQVLDFPVGWFFPPVYSAGEAEYQAEIDFLRVRLKWAANKLRECGKELEFSIGMYRSIADCEEHAKGEKSCP